MILLIAIVVVTQLFGVQGFVEVVQEDVICPTYSKEYITDLDVFFNDQNAIISNFTIIKPFPKEAQVRLVLTGASMGEYVVTTGIDIQMELCDLIDEPIFLGPLFEVLGFSNDQCPPEIGVYGCEGYVMPTDTFPDGFPPNKYMAEYSVSYEGKALIVCQVFCRLL